jgi:LAO/AO transport system kinase
MSDNDNIENEFDSALNVQKGVDQPDSINPEIIKKFRLKNKIQLSVDEYVKGILKGNRTILSQVITLVESSLVEQNKFATAIVEKCLPFARKSIRIGITGVPGVGKSTFIESLGKYLTKQSRKIAVLAVDPSSELTKGSILGDKTRMEELANDPNAFIRPSPSAGSLGGVAKKTRHTIILCEAAGFDTIFIETVGVGQSETAVHSMVDFFLLLMLAGAGDELQGIKRGIMEMADAIAITKADNDNVTKAELAKIEYQNALHLFPPSECGWSPKVLTCSSLNSTGINKVWDIIIEYIEFIKKESFFEKQRRRQAKYWMYESIHEALTDHFYNQEGIKNKLKLFEEKVVESKMNSFLASKILIEDYFNNLKLE